MLPPLHLPLQWSVSTGHKSALVMPFMRWEGGGEGSKFRCVPICYMVINPCLGVIYVLDRAERGLGWESGSRGK